MRDRALARRRSQLAGFYLPVLMMLVAHVAGCRQREATPGPESLTARLLALAAENQRSLNLSLPSREQTRRELDKLVRRARSATRRTPRAALPAALNALLFERLGYRRLVDDPPVESMLLPSVLVKRRGSCVGLGTLYLALGEALGLSLRGVLVPNHFFVRYEHGGKPRDIELLRRGEQMPPAWYRQKYAPPAGNTTYQRALTPRESVAVVRFNLANAFRERGMLTRARALYRQVVQVLPRFAEAQANLGLTLQLLDDRGGATRAYEAARQANPQLAGLQRNLRQLERESTGDGRH